MNVPRAVPKTVARVLAPLFYKERLGEVLGRSKNPPQSPLGKGGGKSANLSGSSTKTSQDLGVRSARRKAARTRWVTFGAALGWAALTFAQNPNAPLPTELTGPITDEELHLPVDAKLAERIDSITDHLDSPLFQEREAARQALIEIGAPAFARLRTEHAHAAALDVRLAIEEIVQVGYLNYHVYDRHGFLGVSLSSYRPNRRAKTQLPPGARGVVVRSVVPDTGAQRAGLVVGDVIISVDDKPLTSPPNRIVSVLAAGIRARRPGTPMMLKVLRAGTERMVEAVVGRCPPEQIRRGRVAVLPQLVDRANARFPIWWNTFFKPMKVAEQEVGKP